MAGHRRRALAAILAGTAGLAAILAHADPSHADSIDAAVARRVAGTFVERHAALAPGRSAEALPIPGPNATRTAQALVGPLRLLVADEAGTLAYVFEIAPSGFVAVSADDALPPVVAYAFESSPDGNPSDAVAGEAALGRLLRADLRLRLAERGALAPRSVEERRREWETLIAPDAVPNDAPREFEQWPPEGTTPTGGWLENNWTQSAPYNALCPLDLAHGGARSVAGCPAVAMAMILNFHETTQATTFGSGDRYWHNYAGNAYWIPDASTQYGFPDFGTLNDHLAVLETHWGQGAPLTNTDKAALTFACGIAARQVYSASISGTYGVDQAYDAYRRFGFDGCRLVFDTDPFLYADLRADMQAARPAHLAIVDPGWTMGHNVVVDGYNTEDYYHLNFGWGGAYNGWYLLPQEIPYGLTVVEGVVLDIVPETTGVPAQPEAPLAPAATGAVSDAGSLRLSVAPSPVLEETRLSFVLPEAGRARVGLYDVGGRKRASVFEGSLASGRQEIVWRRGGLPPGVYFLRVDTAGRTGSRPIVLAP